jgi:drug/metabolite transporter (DMT)-like permease
MASPSEAAARAADTPARVLQGVLLAGLAYMMFTGQDAIMKWIGGSLPILQGLFARSATIIVLVVLLRGPGLVAEAASSQRLGWHLLRGLLILGAWLCYYTAAQRLQLAEMTTLYYAAPLFITVLSVLILKERPGPWRWVAVCAGFLGVAVAADPSGRPDLVPALLVLAAAALWGSSGILVRLALMKEPTHVQMLISNAMFCALTLISAMSWIVPDRSTLLLLVLLGVIGGVSQFLMFEAYRRAPASAVAPMEYTSFLWSVGLGFLVFSDVPGPNVWIGASIIILSSLLAILSARGKAA